MHLTNVSIQKQDENYNSLHGGKWNVTNLRLYLEATRGFEETEQLFLDIDDLLIQSAKAVQNVMINDRHCFEVSEDDGLAFESDNTTNQPLHPKKTAQCYGYDLLIDDNLKPWLVEVNASPSLATTTEADKQMKMSLIRDVLEIIIPDSDINGGGVGSGARAPCKDTGDFVVLYDEAAEQEKLALEEAKRSKAPKKALRSWK